MTKILLVYTPVAKPISDFEIETWYTAKLTAAKFHGYIATLTASQLAVTRFRVGLVEGDFDELILQYNGVDYPVESDGFVSWWNDVPDFQMDLALRLLEGG